jgi:hypothetical protein
MPLTPEQQALQKQIEASRKELIAIANFITDKGLKLKQSAFQEQPLEIFRGKQLLPAIPWLNSTPFY